LLWEVAPQAWLWATGREAALRLRGQRQNDRYTLLVAHYVLAALRQIMRFRHDFSLLEITQSKAGNGPGGSYALPLFLSL
jgi:hypothetical protein